MKEARLASFDGGAAASNLRTLHHDGRDKSDGAYETNFILDRNCTQKTSSMVRLSNTTKPCSLPRRPAPQISSTCHGRLDPRPISDQAFLNSCARQLISYMTAHGYAAVLSPKTLMAPSSKEFASVAIFLFRRADGNFKFGAKAEDDVPTFFKQLRHPFQISKCTLYAVGSLHTWPVLLSALTWLVQLYLYEEEAKCPAKVSKVALSNSFCAKAFDLCIYFAGSARSDRRSFHYMRELCISSELVCLLMTSSCDCH